MPAYTYDRLPQMCAFQRNEFSCLPTIRVVALLNTNRVQDRDAEAPRG